MIQPIVIPMKLEPDTNFFMLPSIELNDKNQGRVISSDQGTYILSKETVIEALYPASINPPNIVRPSKKFVKVVSAPEGKNYPFP